MSPYKQVFSTLILAGMATLSFAQQRTPLEQIRRYVSTQAPGSADTTYLRFLNNAMNNGVNYLYRLYEYLGWETRMKKKQGEKAYYQQLAQELAAAGDYRSSDLYDLKAYDSLPPDAHKFIQQQVQSLKDIQSINASAYVAGRALDAQVVMINEAHSKPLHRAFAYSLLGHLYNQGFRYLALEMLNNFGNVSLKDVTYKTGVYVQEPVAAEMIRKAISLGFTLIPYEDTAAMSHTSTQRDSVQARNIYKVIEKDPKAKIFVLAGYGHIAETANTREGYVPMALAFKNLSGIDPLTVNQTTFTAGSTNEYGKLYYNSLMKRITIDEPVVLLKNKLPYELIDERRYDVYVVHPPDAYKNNRPVWLSFNGERREVSVSPQERNLFLVQAYYEDEFNKRPLEQLVPADQTYVPSDYGYYSLYLKPGKYKIVFRDVGYQQLNVREKQVQ